MRSKGFTLIELLVVVADIEEFTQLTVKILRMGLRFK